eukprot:TRINITY_DN3401_c0_g2_i1.p1 TRINITY_DN3401_c0_g2~~TRINITY_DN3401_c0_g2_i1.p1  ORF type:complete len:336 (+),score=55.37 TRINITY_DN3401_c0_g2_i1:49-1056(+)
MAAAFFPRNNGESSETAFQWSDFSTKSRWADVVDEGIDSVDQLSDEVSAKNGVRQDPSSVADTGHFLSARRARGTVERSRPVPSVGSMNHNNGCKPCAFFYTKGCKSGADCLFCHLCPAHEKAKRKRLKRIEVFGDAAFEVGRDRRYKGRANGGNRERYDTAGHTRVCSGSSVTTAASTWTGSSEGRHHSRQWSSSTQNAVDESSKDLQASESPGAEEATVTAGAVDPNAQMCVFVVPGPSLETNLGDTNSLSCQAGFGGTIDSTNGVGGTSDFRDIAGFAGTTQVGGFIPVAAPVVTYDGVQYTLLPVPADAQSYWDTQQMISHPMMTEAACWW